MKRFTMLGAGLLLLGFIMTGCDTSDAVGPEALTETETQAEARPTYNGAGTCNAGMDFDYCVDLVAGQTQKVGEVFYAYDGTNFTISYQITEPGLCLNLVHYGVYDTTDDVPVRGRGNVSPGSLTYQTSLDCETSFSETVEITGLTNNSYFVLAHAEVVDDGDFDEASCPVIAGIGHGADASIWGDLYYVNPNSGFSQRFFETGLGGIASPIGGIASGQPNGLALDVTTGAYYYSDAAQNFWSHVPGSGTQNVAGDGNLTQYNSGATIANGVYYYMRHSTPGISGDDDLIAVDLGTGMETAECSDFMLPDGQYDLEFGDLAFNPADGLIYTSVYLDNEATTVTDMVTRFFSIDPISCAYTLIDESEGKSQVQLAFGSDDVLYGHATGNFAGSGEGVFFAIDPATGARENLGFMTNADGVRIRFNDLAPADVDCEAAEFDETAWGWGQQTFGEAFGGSQWGWVFEGTYPLP